ncbi:MAG: glycosyltransferase family 4 protein [Lachnospiraceae bacterium]|nr:glycosyltransferase family 4 protein [Lachnospiraceae bacterium]MCI8813743.1 glycosyltransferase family 4 protein [Lachnospiraceae bacterium]
MTKVLMIAFYYEPMNNGGVQRIKYFYNKLKDMGYDTYLVTTSTGEDGEFENDHVFRCRCLMPTHHKVQWFIRRGLDACIRLTSVPYPRKYDWEKAVKKRLETLIPEINPDVCFVTYPPSNEFAIGNWIIEKYHLPVIADFRDGFLYGTVEPYITSGSKRRREKFTEFYSQIEHDIVHNSSAIITAGNIITQGYRDLYRDVSPDKFTTIRNGFDDAEVFTDESFEMNPKTTNIVFTGNLELSRRGYFSYLEPALRYICENHKNVSFYFAGDYTAYELSVFNEYKNIHRLPKQPRGVVIAAQRRADILLSVTGTEPFAINGKLHEYIFSDRPILNLGGGNEGEQIIKHTNAGITISNTDTKGITDFIDKVSNGEWEFKRRNLEQYTRKKGCETLAKIIDDCLE